MSLIYQSFVADRSIAVYELELGMNMRETRLCNRICADELSYDFIVEIAESTLPFRNVHNLMHNIMIRHEWTSKNCNLKAICQMVMDACEKVMDMAKAPATCGNMFGWTRRTPNADEDVLLEPIVESEPKDCDFEGRGVKRYPHTYECILRPWMYEVYKKQDTYKKRVAWESRVNLDGSPRIMERRVKAAEEAKVAPF